MGKEQEIPVELQSALHAALLEAVGRADIAEAHVRQMRESVDCVPEGFALFDASDRYLFWNKAYSEIYAAARDELKVGAPFVQVISRLVEAGVYRDAVGREAEWMRERLRRHAAGESSAEQAMTDGRTIRVAERKTCEGGAVAVHIDITELKRRETALSVIFENNPIPGYLIDQASLRIVQVNQAAVEFYGYSREQFLRLSALQLRKPEDREKFVRAVSRIETEHQRGAIWRHLKANGDEVEVAIHSRPILFDGRRCFVVSAVDISERRAAERRLARVAHTDALTGLPNRAGFNARLADCIEAAAKEHKPFAVLCLNLDRFKEVNELFGYGVGDAMLQQAAARFSAATAPDFIARGGSDEFMAIVEGEVSRERCGALAEQLLAEANKMFRIGAAKIEMGASVGLALFPGDGAASIILAHAEAALWRAKLVSRNGVRFYDRALESELQQRRALLRDLKLGLSRNEFEIHYQPQTDMNGVILGFEALMRWRHPVRGLISPAEFIPLAESSGLIVELDAWILREACLEAASWNSPLRIAVNLSALQFRQADFIQKAESALRESGLAAERLELEVTESVVVDDLGRAAAVLQRLGHLGVTVALDDFGTGYSALSYLQALPFNRIKIDRSFVARLTSGDKAQVIVRAIVQLAQGLGLAVIAEGVETTDQIDILRECGCLEAQGYYFGRPEPISHYESVVHTPTASREGASAA